MTVTDAFLRGDQFEIFDFGVSLGLTSTPQITDACGDNPDPCLADPLVSHGSFQLEPGPHQITIQMAASPFGAGAAYFRVQPSAMDYYTLLPCRLVDTRWTDGPYGGPALTSGQLRDVLIAGQCGIPSNARAVALNVTAINPTGSGFLRAFPAGVVEPATSSLTFSAGQIRANNWLIALSGGRLSLRALIGGSPGTVHLVIDVNGYFQ